MQAMQQHLQRLKQLQRQRRSSSGSGAGEPPASGAAAAAGAGQRQPKRSLFPMQVNLTAEEVSLRFEHHPLEVRCGL
jgi:hypothetical protein